MNGWLSMTAQERKTSLEQASVRSGIGTKALEKDWWVTASLKALFSTPYAAHCIFKGGTSLSKGWKLIQRFSEDVDIALDPEAFGMAYLPAPSHSYVKNLKRKGCEFTSTVMKAAMEKAFAEIGIHGREYSIVAEEVPLKQPDKDPQTLFIRYTSILDTDAYLADEVKMEFGVRSLREPFSPIIIQSLLFEFFPNDAYQETPFEIMAVEPRKTMMEKLFLLHEKFSAGTAGNVRGERQSRHLYDIVSLLQTPAANEALEDAELYQRLIDHRKNYVRLPGINYADLQPATVRFVPGIEWLDMFRKDYSEMQGSMIYGASPSFEEIIQQLKIFNGRFRLTGSGHKLEDVIHQFLFDHKDRMKEDRQLNNIYSGNIKLSKSDGSAFHYRVVMHKIRDEWIFADIVLLK